jgi:hypothetical protein
VAGHEHESQEIVPDVIVERLRDFIRGFVRPRAELMSDLLVLPIGHLIAPQPIDPAPLRRLHQPCAGIVRHSRLGPLLQRGDEGVLSEILGDADVADDACEPGDELRRLDAPDRLDGAMD